MTVRAVAVMSIGRVKGHVSFVECRDGRTRVTIDLQNVPPGDHGLHIHRYGDLRQGCTSLCDHYNPFNRTHGGRKDTERHVGDLGNITAGSDRRVRLVFYDSLVRLSGPTSVIGRSVVIHAKPDDLGRGGDAESLLTGNAGKRIACGVIGLAA